MRRKIPVPPVIDDEEARRHAEEALRWRLQVGFAIAVECEGKAAELAERAVEVERGVPVEVLQTVFAEQDAAELLDPDLIHDASALEQLGEAFLARRRRLAARSRVEES